MSNQRSILARAARSPWTLLLFAFALAAGVAFLAYNYLQQREVRIKEEVAARSAKSETPKVAVAVPIVDVAAGAVIDKSRFSARQVDEDLVYPDTVTAAEFAALEGQQLARPILRGRPLRLTDLRAPEVNDVAAVLPPGMRALTIDIDNVNSFAQTLRPGHLVDLFLINKVPRSSKDSDLPDEAMQQAELFMQNMQVLATGREFRDLRGDLTKTDKMVRPGDIAGADKHDFDTVTLLVTPTQAARLLVGQKMGSYRVALRGSKDDAQVKLAALRSGDLMPRSGPKARDEGVEFIVGGKGGGADMVSLRALRAPQGTGAAPQPSAAPTQPGATAADIEQMLRRVADPRRGSTGGSRGVMLDAGGGIGSSGR